MKNVLTLIPCLALLLAAGCTDKKNRLTTDTLTMAVQSESSVNAGAQLSLRAVCKSAKSDDVDIAPVWSVSNNAGTFSVAKGKNTYFVAGSNPGTCVIKASYGSISAEKQITINTSGGNPPQPPSDPAGRYFGIWSETYVNPTYNVVKLDTANPGDARGGYLGAWGDAAIGESNLGDNSTYKTEGQKSLRCQINAGSSGGWWVQFGYSTSDFSQPQVKTDLSNYYDASLKFDVKTTKDIVIKLEWGDGLSAPINLANLYPTYLDNNWHSVSIPLVQFLGIDFTTIRIPAGFHSANGQNDYTFYIDNVRWEKP